MGLSLVAKIEGNLPLRSLGGAGQEVDAPLGVFQPCRAQTREAHPLLEGAERRLERKVARLESGDQGFQLTQGLFEGWLAHSYALTQVLPQAPLSTPRTTH